MRVIVGGILQESNTFSPSSSDMESFRSHVFVQGAAMETMPIDNEIKGFYKAAAECGITCIPTLFGQAISSGKFGEEAFEELKRLLELQIRQAGECDGIYFAFHGAMVVEGCDDAEGEMLSVIRNAVGTEIPLVISLDLHANVTRRMIRQVDGIAGYRTFPHVDFADTGYRAGQLLASVVRQELSPKLAFVKIPMIVPAENSQTTRGPFAELWKEAERGEMAGDSVATSLFPVQPWLDIEELGFSIVVVGKDQQKAQKEAERLADLAWDLRHAFDIRLYSVDEVVQIARSEPVEGPIVISDSADSPGAGATGDSNAVLKRLLELGAESRLSCIMTMVDAKAVAQAIEAGVGSRTELCLGYSNNVHGGRPLTVEGIVKRIGDGKFLFRDGFAKNTEGRMGRCVVFQIEKISILLSEKPTFTGDPAMYRSMGLEPLDHELVLVKSANQFRAEYEKLSQHIYILDTPGCSPARLSTLPFSKITQPYYPFDDHFNWRGTSDKTN